MKKCTYCNGSGKEIIAYFQGVTTKAPCKKCHGKGMK